MRTSNAFRTCTSVAAMSSILIAGCARDSQTGSLIPDSSALRQAHAQRANTANYQSLYSFGESKSEGATPMAGLIAADEELFGTTVGGGGKADSGTVFRMSASGVVRVLYGFKGGPWNGANTEAADPETSLVAFKGELYGTTYITGDVRAVGTVFAVNPSSGAQRIVHRFGGYGDGADPAASLLELNGQLYGVTASGGKDGFGTVFELDPTNGKERVLYSFGSNSNDGDQPGGSVVALKGNLYGTTVQGGGSTNGGTLYEVTVSGKERVLHQFKGIICGPSESATTNDGGAPNGPLAVIGGKIYGATECGGGAGAGTIFEYDPATAKERVVYGFGGGSDGAAPTGLIGVDGALYGTTLAGGKTYTAGSVTIHCGVVFRVTTSGQFSTLYEFEGNNTDGCTPVSPLALFDGALYGTTQNGGAQNEGTAFKLSLGSQKGTK